MFNNYDIGRKYFLEHLPLILMCRETKCGCHHITFVEPARRQIAQHGAHILVFAHTYSFSNLLPPISRSTMLHFWMVPFSVFDDCTPKASPWRTTFKIFVSIMCINKSN